MKKVKAIKKITLLLILTVVVIAIKNKVEASTVSGHYTYNNNSDGTITITKYDNTPVNNLVIPDTLDGKTVTSIEREAFYNCSGLTGSLTIPDSVTSIGERAFDSCSGLRGSLIIGNSVTSIGNHAFYKCSGLTGSLTIGNSVTSIGRYAFWKCSGLTGSLIIGNSVTSIGADAFYECSGLTGSLTIGNSVTSIGEYAFLDCSGLTGSLTIPNSVTSIGDSAFYNCSGLDKIIFFENAPNIGSDTFYEYNKSIYYRKGTTGYDVTGWPTTQMVEYDESLKKNEFTFTNLSSTSQVELGENLADAAEVSYSSENANIAKVDENGKITPVGNGKTNIVVNLKYSESVTRTLKASVTVDIKITNISLDKSGYTFNNSNLSAITLKSNIEPANANNKVLNWTSSNANIAKVSSTGLVTPVSNGTCRITATTTDGTNLVASCDVTVDIKATGIKLNKTSYVVTDSNSTLLLKSTITPSIANKNVTWTSSNANIAKVSSTGLVTPVSNGTCKITATTTDGSMLYTTCAITSNVEYQKGDINQDGVININDAYKGLKGFTDGTITEEEKIIGDVNSDGVFNINDIYKLMQYSVGKISSLD